MGQIVKEAIKGAAKGSLKEGKIGDSTITGAQERERWNREFSNRYQTPLPKQSAPKPTPKKSNTPIYRGLH